jgi:hypothetical protein
VATCRCGSWETNRCAGGVCRGEDVWLGVVVGVPVGGDIGG